MSKAPETIYICPGQEPRGIGQWFDEKVTDAEISYVRSDIAYSYACSVERLDARTHELGNALRNCLALASRRLQKGSNEVADWEHIVRFCREAGITHSPLRQDEQIETMARDALTKEG